LLSAAGGNAQAAESAPATPPAQPFACGEQLTYTIRWGLITAGSAKLTVQPPTLYREQPALQFTMTASTAPWIDKLFKVRDRVDSYVSPDLSQNLFYHQSQHEGHYSRELEVAFDWTTRRVQATINGEKREWLPVPVGTVDPLSALYVLRSRPLAMYQTIELSVTDGKKCVAGQGIVLKPETIKTPAGSFDTYLIEPELKDLAGVFKKSPNAKVQIWVTRDPRHLVVKVASKVIVGHFTAELTEIRP
jgi:hypothetical protein